MTRSKPGLCVACRQSEQWWDERRTAYSPFCGKTCRASMANISDILPLCYFCGNEKIFVGPDGENSLYCSQSCRTTASVASRKGRRHNSATIGQLIKNTPLAQQKALVRSNSAPPIKASHARGGTPQARDGTLQARDGMVTTTRQKAVVRCTLPPSPTCSNYGTQGPAIVALDNKSRDYQSVYDQFLAGWRHPTTIKGKPTVDAIYRVVPSAEVANRYDQYRNVVESDGPFYGQTFQGLNGLREMTVGNEQRRFHGTGRKCEIAVDGKTDLCSDQTCGVCGIIANSFALKFFGTKTQRGRFGVGIYFSATSSKSDDYSDNSARKLSEGQTLKCMLLSKVVVGHGTKLYQSDWNRLGPDAGDHSVIGEVGGVLNYDEVVVYREEACFPQYLISYTV